MLLGLVNGTFRELLRSADMARDFARVTVVLFHGSQAFANCVLGQRCQAAEVQLGHEMFTMCADGFHTQVQAFGDLLAGKSFRQ